MEPQIALRVIRGPDWHYGEEDGGDGCAGSVVAIKDGEEDKNTAIVIWDNGNGGDYRCGVAGKYDLRVLESSPSGIVHTGVSCDACVHPGLNKANLTGFRWKCGSCHDFDLCTSCYMKDKHSTRHRFVQWTGGKPQTLCPPRADSKDKCVYPRGIFKGAKVVRGADWEYGTRDGGAGNEGTVTSWEGDISKFKGLVQVEWPNKDTGRYRVGHQGKVDLKCTEPAILSTAYYIDHLPILGAPYERIGDREFVVGDLVKVELDVDMFELMQEGHGGWADNMPEVRSRLGIVFSIDNDGDLRVRYEEKAFFINPEAVVKVECPPLERGEIVRVMDDCEEMVKLQRGFGGWNEDMTELLGRAAVVKDITEGIIHIFCNERPWAVCPLSLKQADDITEEEKEALSPTAISVLSDDRDSSVVRQLRMQLLLMKTMDTENSDILSIGTLLDDKEAVESYLKKFPNDINAKHKDKTALHCAASVGNVDMVKMLVDYNANVDILDDEGMSALHICAIRGYADVITLLLEHGADPNIVNSKGHTPIVTAVGHGHAGAVAALAKHKKTNLCAQNFEGETAVHIAILTKELDCLKELITAKADLSCVNFKLNKPIHLAVVKNFPEAVREMVLAEPEIVNSRNDEECVPLHLSSGLNREEITLFLLSQPLCDLETRSIEGFTPLHGAVLKGEANMVEVLVTHGANVNAIDRSGDTPLHLDFSTKSQMANSTSTPILTEIRQDLLREHASVETFIVVACFLILQGANRTLMNYSGETAMEKRPLELSIVEKYVEDKRRKGASWINAMTAKQVNGGDDSSSVQDMAEGSGCSGYISPESSPSENLQSHQEQTNGLLQQHKLEPLKQRTSGSLQQQLTNSSSPSSVEQDVSASCSNPKTATNSSRSSFSHSKKDVDRTETVPVCRLCDNLVTIKMEPCGHAVVCHVCARRARKCLQCRKPVTAVVNT